MTEWIDISEVLAEMEKVGEGGQLAVFSISWVRVGNGMTGKRGGIKHVARAAKFTKPWRKPQNYSPTAWQFKKYNAIPIQDLDKHQLVTPKFTHIIEFNGKKVRHYGAQR